MNEEFKDAFAEFLSEYEHKHSDDQKEVHIFSKKEVEGILWWVSFRERLLALGWIGKWLLWILITSVLVLSNIDKLKEFIR